MKDKKKGPKCKSKRTEKLAKRVLAIRFKSPEKDMYEITDILTEECYNISARSVARVLSEHGVTLKKRDRKLEFYTFGEKRFEVKTSDAEQFNIRCSRRFKEMGLKYVTLLKLD